MVPLAFVAAQGTFSASLERDLAVLEPEEARAELERASEESARAEARANRFSAQAQEAGNAAQRTAQEAAAIAAQIQQAEAQMAAARARYSLAQSEREALSYRLAERQAPLVRLTSALQTSARRPLALSALQPGSLKDLVYVRAVLGAAVPEIRQRTAALRSELQQGKALEQQAKDALANLSRSEAQLRTRRSELSALEAQQRLTLRDARNLAQREGERALVLAEEARDLNSLTRQLDEAARLRRELAVLPGPIMRPRDISAVVDEGQSIPANSGESADTPRFQMPAQGRLIRGYGIPLDSGLLATNLTIAPAPAAQIVAPAAGRIAFAGPYRGFGRIVIIEHEGGWISLVTGLDRVESQVGDRVIGGAPLGVASREAPRITIELRRDGEPVNPLNFMG